MAEELELQAESLGDLLARFDSFHDAEVRLVEISPLASAITVELVADDGRAEFARRRVRFTFEDMIAWSFEGGSHVSWQYVFEVSGRAGDGIVLVSFDGADLDDRTPEDVIGESAAFVAASRRAARSTMSRATRA